MTEDRQEQQTQDTCNIKIEQPYKTGVDDIVALVVYGAEKDVVATAMEEMGQERGIEGFRRDAKNVRDSFAVVLIGVRGDRSLGLDCGACGYGVAESLMRLQGGRAGTSWVLRACLRSWTWGLRWGRL